MAQLRDIFTPPNEVWKPNHVADELWNKAMLGWRTTYLGFVALPTAAALTASAAVAYATTLPERSMREIGKLGGQLRERVHDVEKLGGQLRERVERVRANGLHFKSSGDKAKPQPSA